MWSRARPAAAAVVANASGRSSSSSGRIHTHSLARGTVVDESIQNEQKKEENRWTLMRKKDIPSRQFDKLSNCPRNCKMTKRLLCREHSTSSTDNDYFTTRADATSPSSSSASTSKEAPSVDAKRKHFFSTAGKRPKARVNTGTATETSYKPPIHDDAHQQPAGILWKNNNDNDNNEDEDNDLFGDRSFIPQISLHGRDGRQRKRVLVLCTGGTLTMAPDPHRGGALAPVEGALTSYLSQMTELVDTPNMPEVIAHEYTPLLDSSDMGPADWALLARDIEANYYHFDGFVVLMGTDTMAYAATALSFMLENLGKPVVFTGSQIPLCEPYNDARRNLIMALIFAARNSINEVSIFFHDRLLRACRSTKVNTTRLMAFDSPNMDALAKIGITIEENEHLAQPPPRGALRVHTLMDTRLLTLRLIPGFDDAMMTHILHAARQTSLRGLVLQLYGTGNLPSYKHDFCQTLAEATKAGVIVVANTQCQAGSVMMGHYATGRALEEAGVISANDMTVEATSCKLAYLLGRGDLSEEEVKGLMDVSLRGEVTPAEALPPPPLSSAYQRASRKGKKFL